MQDRQIFKIVSEIIASTFNTPVETIDYASSPQNISNWDSLKHIELVMEIEQKFGVQFDPAKIPLLNSVQNICDLLVKNQEVKR